MPVRSLNSSVLRWPRPAEVERAAGALALQLAGSCPELLRLGYFGSYARGDWGVGSDVDLVAIVAASDRPFIERARDFDVTHLPVPADLLVYTSAEWSALLGEENPFARRIGAEVKWLYVREPGSRA